MKFTPSQLEAIQSTSPRIAVIAGPGSGKTSVLVARIKRLIVGGVDPKSIVVITFTNNAAREIENRLALDRNPARKPANLWPSSRSVPDDEIALGYAGTLHGFALRICRAHGNIIGLPPRLAVLSEEQAETLLKQVIADLKVKLTMKEVREALKEGPGIALYGGGQLLTDPAQIVCVEYYKKLVKSGLMDFDSVLKFALLILRKHIHAFCEYLFWDEVQDSGSDDFDILNALYVENKFIVGDPDQSVYQFRGAAPERFAALLLKGQWQQIRLEENFRCAREICAAANSLIRRNADRIDKATIPARPDEGVVEHWCGFDEEGEIKALVQSLRRQPDLQDCAVLVRYNALTEKIAKGLEGYSIPVVRRQKSDAPADWAKARELVTLLANPENDLLMYWWLVRTQSQKVADVAKLGAMKSFKSIYAFLPPSERLPILAALSDGPQALARSGISAESIALIHGCIATLSPDATIGELALALGDEELHTREIGAGVTVTTVHGGKGREWRAVYLPAMEEGMLPSGAKSEDEAEARRLAFVAVTRAKDLLVVSHAKYRSPLWGKGGPVHCHPSRFIAEMNL